MPAVGGLKKLPCTPGPEKVPPCGLALMGTCCWVMQLLARFWVVSWGMGLTVMLMLPLRRQFCCVNPWTVIKVLAPGTNDRVGPFEFPVHV